MTQESMPHTRKRNAKRVVVVLVILAVLAVAAVITVTELQRRTIATADGPAEQRVDFIETENPVFFGPSKVRLILRNKNREAAHVDAILYNDGKRLEETNWTVEWINGGVRVQLLGEEQDPQTCTLTLNGAASCKASSPDMDDDQAALGGDETSRDLPQNH